MRTFPVDIDPKQIVRWVIAEHQATPTGVKSLARRTIELRQIPIRSEFHLGDEEREDLSEVAVIATLEITPVHASDGWVLRVEVEDEIGPRGPDKGLAIEGEQQIDIGSFYGEFIRSGRGTASVTAEVEDSAAEARMAHLLDSIEKNRHDASRSTVAGQRGKDSALP
ncbi:MAG TPA: hypothetical protein VMT22_02110 [Terriglobales bacterium]|jgi:hypothetical protein|nr:hypothetical protein [Terriglobales bacterium]